MLGVLVTMINKQDVGILLSKIYTFCPTCWDKSKNSEIGLQETIHSVIFN